MRPLVVAISLLFLQPLISQIPFRSAQFNISVTIPFKAKFTARGLNSLRGCRQLTCYRQSSARFC